jgi:hypothetical protein
MTAPVPGTAYGQINSPIFWDKHDPAPWECQPGGSVKDAADIFLKHVPGAQLNMGTPFYGYQYTNINQLFASVPMPHIPPMAPATTSLCLR